MCRVTSTPLNFILTRGQQIKVSTQLHKKALERGYIVPNMKKTKDAFDEEEGHLFLILLLVFIQILLLL